VFPTLKNYNVSIFTPDKKYDYVVVNYYNILREGFDDSSIRKNYKPIYKVFADKAVLVTVYKK